MRLISIHRYPVKSMRGEDLAAALIEPWGLAGDRRWMVVDHEGECVTARKHPQLLQLTPRLEAGGIHITAPDREPLVVTVGELVSGTPVQVHGRRRFLAQKAGPVAARWLSDYLDLPGQLVYADDPTRRSLNEDFSQPGDCAAFADGYPLSLATQSSLAKLNEWIAAGPHHHEGPLAPNRFRANLVIDGAQPYAEDSWRVVRIGAAVFRSPKGIARCVLTTTDAETSARGKEPIATLSQYRRFDNKTWFGMHLIPDNPGVTIEPGDEVEILVAEPSVGPPRPADR